MEKNLNDDGLNMDYIGYYMLIESLKDISVNDSLQKALYLLKIYVESDDIVLFKLNENDEYIHYSNNALMSNNSKVISIILNQGRKIIEKKNFFNFETTINDKLNKFLFIPITFNDSKYVMTITNPKKNFINNDPNFFKIIKESMSVILEKYELYDIMKQNSKIDNLTGLDNRNSYNERMEEIDDNKNNIVFGIFDLFRLKYINDNYSHLAGDKYISETAEVLKNYFPKYQIVQNEQGKLEKKYTGNCVYRIGGDEFALISSDSLDLVKAKANLIEEEIKSLDLGINDKLPLAINYGLVQREETDKARDLYLKADKLLMEDKNRIYQELGIDRRK